MTKKIKITLQEVFNKVWERAKVKKKSFDSCGAFCSYRNGDGSPNHCFVGILIPDDRYNPAMEQGSISVNKSVSSLFNANLHQALGGLQYIHDSCDPNNWEYDLRKFAKDHRLKVPA